MWGRVNMNSIFYAIFLWVYCLSLYSKSNSSLTQIYCGARHLPSCTNIALHCYGLWNGLSRKSCLYIWMTTDEISFTQYKITSRNITTTFRWNKRATLAWVSSAERQHFKFVKKVIRLTILMHYSQDGNVVVMHHTVAWLGHNIFLGVANNLPPPEKRCIQVLLRIAWTGMTGGGRDKRKTIIHLTIYDE